MSTDAPQRYTSVAKAIHWIMAGLIVTMVLYGWTMDDQEGAELGESLSYHALGGLLILGFAALRLSWRIAHPPPALPETLSKRQRLSAKMIHLSLYVSMFLVPLTGLIAGIAHQEAIILPGGMDVQQTLAFVGRNGFDLKREVHAQAMHMLVALTIGHIGAALIHQFWLKDGLMRRMLTEEAQN